MARPAHAAPPPAGTSISNQASATYSDASGVARTVSSNLVQTTVTQVYSLTLTADGAQSATAGSVVYYPHTLTNTGNGTDSFTLSAASASTQFQATNVQIFLDNGSGQPTGSAIAGNVSVASGATYKFIVQATVPTSATAGQKNDITVTAKSVGDTSQSKSNTDTTTATSNAVIKLNKTVSVASGKAGDGPFTYTLTYTNTGNSDATNVVITDPLPGGLAYVTGSAGWSLYTGSIGDTAVITGTNGTTLTMASDSAANQFKATISKVAPGQSGWVTFTFKVGSSTAPGVQNNTANVSYITGGGSASAASNQVGFSVLQTAAVSITNSTVASAAAGSTVTFKNTVTNGGNGTDSFNITIANVTFPTGTTFALYKSDGVTPLVDTGSPADSIPDTGPMSPGATYDVYVKATLPPNASTASAVTATVTATSVFDATVKANGTDTLSAITSAKVDLLAVNSSGTQVGGGAGPEASGVVTNTTNPNTATAFTLLVKNTGTQPDTYNLAASTDASFAAVSLPTGWTVDFKSDGGSGNACSTTAGTISNTGTVAVNGSATVCAVVTVPAGYTAGNVQLYFRALSPSSTAADRLHAVVTVNAVRSLTLTPVGTGQTYSGGSYVYTHTLTNTGNVDEGGASATLYSTMTPALSNNVAGWTSTLYYDSNKNGVLDSGDTLVTGDVNAVLTGGLLAKGASITLFNKVIAPSGASAGAVNVTTITVTTANGAAASGGYSTTAPAPTVTSDNTTVIAGNLTLTKFQALDTGCTGSVAAASYSQAALNAKPGDCVMYQITVTNVGAADATNVIVSDGTPSYTKISVVATTTSGQITGPTAGNAGTINAYIGTGASSTATPPAGGTLAAGQSATITFGVQITP